MFELRRDEFLARSASVGRLVKTVSPELHAEILRATSTGLTRYWVSSEPLDSPIEWQKIARVHLLESWRPPEPKEVQIQPEIKWEMLANTSQFGSTNVRLMQLKPWNGFGLTVPVSDGAWLNAVTAKPQAIAQPAADYYGSLAITILLLSLVSILAARRVGLPLRRLTEAAESLGRGEEIPKLPESGPDDIRRLSTAFNRMQSRLRRFVEDRTRMIAAISHDLRTPITSMRLRAEFIEDEEMRKQFVSALDEMKAMAESTLAFAREDATQEETRATDMNALLGSLCADLVELGWQVEFTEVERVVYRCRPGALRRAFRNVIENSIRYGKRARVSLITTPERLQVIIEDDGPGIAIEDRERVFEPFVRLENSRNRSTGGAGLGLSIARSIVRSHGGDIQVLDGSRVRLYLPN